MELRALDARHFAKIEQSRHTYEQIVKDILMRSPEQPQMKIDDVHVTAMAILSMLTGITGWFNQKGRLSEDDIVACYCRLGARMTGQEPAHTQNRQFDTHLNPSLSIRS